MDSDTESEPENSLPKCAATEFAKNFSSQLHHDIVPDDLSTNACKAVEVLTSIEVKSVIQDSTCHVDIERASNAILAFTAAFIASSIPLDEASQETLTVFSCLLKKAFVLLLLDYRMAFHSIAAREIPRGTARSSIICWVDVILSELAEAVVSGSRHTSDDPQFLGFRQQRDDDNLRAAAQLPYEWKNVVGLISSDNASPAAARLALRLAFAVYIIGSSRSEDEAHLSGADNKTLQSALDAYIQKVALSNQTSLDRPRSALGLEIQMQERSNHAMVVGLYAIGFTEFSTFRPHSSAILLRFIQHVMHPVTGTSDLDLTSPILDLDLPQRLLIRWGSFVPWSWKNWQDDRVVGSESLIHLNSTWIYHIGILETGLPWESALRCEMEKDANFVGLAVLRILRQIINSMTSYSPTAIEPPTTVVLYKSIWLTAQLLDSTNDRSVITSGDLVCCLLGLFALVGPIDHEAEVKDLILQGLACVEAGAFKAAFSAVQEDTGINFTMKIDVAVSNITRSISQMASDTKETTAVRQTLDFLAVVWNSVSPGSLNRQTISSFVSSLIECLSASDEIHPPLQRNLLTALACLEGASHLDIIDKKTWDNEKIWLLALKSEPTDLLSSSAFASYVISTAKNMKCDPLLFAEAWDHLRDCLLLIMTRHFLGDEEPLALLIAGSVCHALTCLLLHADVKAGDFIVSSPWTLSLYESLGRVLDFEGESERYGVVLKERLLVHGAALRTQISRIMSSTQVTLEVVSAHLDQLDFSE